MNETIAGPILTTEGIPLKVSLQKAERRNKIRAALLVAPLLLFILVTFLIPIGDMSPMGIKNVTSIKSKSGATKRAALILFLLSAF